MKKVLININSIVKYSGSTHLSGIGRSTISLLNEFAKISDLPFQIILYSQRLKGDGLKDYKFPFRSLRIPFPNYQQFTNLINLFNVKEVITGYDLYHIPHNTDQVAKPDKTIFTIHDLMIYRFPEFFPYTDEFDKWAKKIIKDCRAVVTCSDSSKNDISNFWNISPEKISVIRWGIDRNIFFPANTMDVEMIKSKLKIKLPYFVAVSNSHPRKNAGLILKSFREFIKTNNQFQLVFLWSNPPKDLVDNYASEILSEKILFANHLNDSELRCLYSGASATLYPSLQEGFGFPVLESFACHTPVITCNNSSLKEVGGDIALYTSESDVSEFVMHLSNISNGINKKKFVYEVEMHLLNFKWETASDQYIKLYKTLLK